MSEVLHLTLKKKWFDMILSGEKKEEYREKKPYWVKRIQCKQDEIKTIVFRNGYSSNAPELEIEFKGMFKDVPNPKWTDDDPGKEVFVLILGNILRTANI